MQIIHADARDALRDMADASVDACVTDPPYGLKFMGRHWDAEDACAFDPAFWVEVLRVLKPGAHLIAFGGTRTYHRLVCAIEDAGFEIRDQIAWLFGSGFPKSHDVSKGIDRAGAAPLAWFGPWLRTERERIGMSQKELAERGGFYDKVNRGGLVANWELGYGTPSAAQFNKVCEILSLPFERIEEVEREVIGQRRVNKGVAFTSDGPDTLDVTAPATEAARQWQGWGTALKPAHEPIVLARKPLSGTVAATVLQHGTGALNIDACRIETNGPSPAAERRAAARASGNAPMAERVLGSAKAADTEAMGKLGQRGSADVYMAERPSEQLGRWPANVLLDGSEEVLGGFPESEDGVAVQRNGGGQRIGNLVYSGTQSVGARPDAGFGGGGSAARFFYTAKADAADRLQSKHPTVKPVDLMAYLVKLVTPPGGLVLDPFAGSGTTGMACMREGFRAILIEREAEYIADIRRRLAHVRGDDTPLFCK